MFRSLQAALIVALTAAVLPAAPAAAQEFPTRPVRIIIGFGPGAIADLTGRLMGTRMGQMLGQQFVVESKTGAGSSLAAEYVARAPKDGHTLFLATVANTINHAVSNLSFDFGKDLAPIVLIGTSPHILTVHPSLGVNSVQELIALAKAKPGELAYASSGVGTLSHLSGELLNKLAGIKLTQVPYPGSAQGVSDVLAGRVPMMFSPASTVWQYVIDGKLKALATTQAKRVAMAPDLPTMQEAGLQGYDAGIWMGLLAPAGTPRAVVEKLSSAANESLRANDVLSPLRAQGLEVQGGTPEEFARYIDGELKKWSSLAADAGLKK